MVCRWEERESRRGGEGREAGCQQAPEFAKNGIILSLAGRTPRCNQCSITAIVGKLIYLREKSGARKLPPPTPYHPKATRW